MEQQEFEKLREELIELRRLHQEAAVRIAHLEEKLRVDSAPISEYPAGSNQSTARGQANMKERIEQQRASLEKTFTRTPASLKEKSLEFQIGGTWLNRIGVVAVILGLAYFLKYSFDNNWIGPTGRVLLGVFAGLAMLIAGERLRHKYQGYAQGLLGGGSLALFLSIYAGYDFYRLISPAVTFMVLTLVMVNTVFMAVRHDSLPIGILGIIGGFAIPFMVGSNDPSLWRLFGYLVLLTGGVLGVSIYKKWTGFMYLSFIINQLILSIFWGSQQLWWRKDFYQVQLPGFIFVAIIFLLYLGVAGIYNMRRKKKAGQWDMGLTILNAFLFFVWSMVMLDGTIIDDYMGFYAAFLALIYIYLGRAAYWFNPEDKGQVYSLFLVAFVLVTIAIPLQLTGGYIGLAWLAEAVGLTYLARTLMIDRLAYGGLVALVLGLVITFGELETLWRYKVFLFNTPTLLLACLLAAVLLIIKLLKDMEKVVLFKLKARSFLQGLFLLLVFLGLSIENQHFFQLRRTEFFLSPEQLALSGLWLIYAIVLFVAGIKKKNRHLRYVALGLLAVIIFKAFLVDLASLEIMLKILLFIILGLSLLGISYYYQKKQDVIGLKGENDAGGATGVKGEDI